MTATLNERAVQRLPFREYKRIPASGTGDTPAEVPCPISERWRVFGTVVSYLNSGAGNRTLSFLIGDGSEDIEQVSSGISNGAGSISRVFYGPGLPDSESVVPPPMAGRFYVPLPELVVLPGEIICIASDSGNPDDEMEVLCNVEAEFV